MGNCASVHTKGVKGVLGRIALVLALAISLVPAGALPSIIWPVDAYANEGEGEIYPDIKDYIADSLAEGSTAMSATNESAEIPQLDMTGGMTKVSDLMVNYTMADKAEIGDMWDIDEIWKKAPQAMVHTIPSFIDLYDVGDENWLVGFLDTPQLTGVSEPLDIDVYVNNEEHPYMLNDQVRYDASKGLIYIPKTLQVDPEYRKNYVDPEIGVVIKVQILHAVDFTDENAMKKAVDVIIDNQHKGVTAPNKSQYQFFDTMDTLMQIPVATVGTAENLDLSCLEVRINGSDTPLYLQSPEEFEESGAEGAQAVYNPETGVLLLGVSAYNVSSVDIKINDNGMRSGNEANRAYAVGTHVGDWYYYTPDQVNAISEVGLDVDPDELYVGMGFTYKGYFCSEAIWSAGQYMVTFNPGGTKSEVFTKWHTAFYESRGEDDSSLTFEAIGADTWTDGIGKEHLVEGHPELWGTWVWSSDATKENGRSITSPNCTVTTGAGKQLDLSSDAWNAFGGWLTLYCGHGSFSNDTNDYELGADKQKWMDLYGRVIHKADDDSYVIMAFNSPVYGAQQGLGAYKIKLDPYIGVNLEKSWTDTTCTDGNDNYSLAGAEYTFYTDAECTQVATNKDGEQVVLTTDENGNATTGEKMLKKQTYYVKETQQPKGAKLDPTVYTITPEDVDDETKMALLEVEDEPVDDPIGVIVYKGSDEFGPGYDSGMPRLAGAVFEISYYKGSYKNEAELKASGEQPSATARWTTNSLGAVDMYGAPSSGTWPYEHTVTAEDHAHGIMTNYSVGTKVNSIPIGTATIREVEAPSGYQLNDKLMGYRVVAFDKAWNGVGRVPWPNVFDRNPEDDSVLIPNVKDPNDNGNNGEFSIFDPTHRGDFKFVKTVDQSQKRLAGVPFALIDTKTGEWHVVVTGDNGIYESAANYKKHTYKTNANDAAVSGIKVVKDANGNYSLDTSGVTVDASKLDPDAGLWFYGRADGANKVLEGKGPRDDKGALPYASGGGSYTMVELLVKGGVNDGLTMVSVPDIKSPKDNRVYDLGTVDNQTEGIRSISTEARDNLDGDHFVTADTESHFVDRVAYREFENGKQYRMKAWLVYRDIDPETGTYYTADKYTEARPVLIDENGEPVYFYQDFTAKLPNGSVDVHFEGIDTRELAGKEITVFEEAYDVKTGALVASHRDMGDYNQSLLITEPEIGTTLVDGKTGGKVVAVDDEAVLIDTVEYRNLVPGKTYVGWGKLMVKTDFGVTELRDAEGNVVTGSTTFTPKDANGTFEVEFRFDASLLSGYTLVAYETVGRPTDPDNPSTGEEDPDNPGKPDNPVADHEDPDDPGQTVTVEPVAFDTDMASRGSWLDDKAVVADSEAVLVDTIHYERAVEGDEYTVHGMLFDTNTGLPLLAYAPADDDPYAFKPVDEKVLKQFADEWFNAIGIGNAEGAYDPTAGEFTDWPVAYDKEAVDRLLSNPAYEGIADRIVTAETTFTPESGSGDVDITYDFDARFVPTEKVTSMVYLTHDKENQIVAGGLDINDEREQAAFVTPKIGTTATDATDGDKYVLNSTEATIKDTVTYTGLVAGKEYTLKATLMNKETGEPLIVKDEVVTAETVFVPAASEGSVDVIFTFDASELMDLDVVAFEQLWREMEIGDDVSEPVKVTTHEDIDDEDQTVNVTANPPETPEPETPMPSTGEPEEPKGSVFGKTGLDVVLPIGAIVIGLAGLIAGVYIWRRRRDDV